MSAQSLRPRSVTEILDAAFHVYRANFAALTTLATLTLLPFVVMGAVFGAGVGAVDMAGGEPDAPTPALLAVTGILVVLSPLFIAWFLLAQAAMQRAMADAYLGETVSWSGALRAARSRFWRLLGASIVKGLVVCAPMVAGMILLGIAAMASPALVPAVVLALGAVVMWLLLRLLFIPATIVLEENDVGGALRRSWELTAGHVWRSLGAMVLAYLIMIALQLTVMGIVTVASNFAIGQIAANLVSIVTYPIVAGVVVLLYYDVRIRKEGFDLEVMSADLARLPEPPGLTSSPVGAEAPRRIR